MQINLTKNFSLFTLDRKIYGLKKGVHNVLSHSFIFTQAIVDTIEIISALLLLETKDQLYIYLLVERMTGNWNIR